MFQRKYPLTICNIELRSKEPKRGRHEAGISTGKKATKLHISLVKFVNVCASRSHHSRWARQCASGAHPNRWQRGGCVRCPRMRRPLARLWSSGLIDPRLRGCRSHSAGESRLWRLSPATNRRRVTSRASTLQRLVANQSCAGEHCAGWLTGWLCRQQVCGIGGGGGAPESDSGPPNRSLDGAWAACGSAGAMNRGGGKEINTRATVRPSDV